MIISNWSVIRDDKGSLRIRGLSIDRADAEDGMSITTSPIQFSGNGVVTTLSGSNYFLGAPASPAEKEKLELIEGFLTKRDNIPEEPFKGIIENWKMVQHNGAIMIGGKSYGHITLTDGKDITIQGISSKDGFAVVTSSGSRYRLGMPHIDTHPEMKRTLLSTLNDVNAPALPQGTVIGFRKT